MHWKNDLIFREYLLLSCLTDVLSKTRNPWGWRSFRRRQSLWVCEMMFFFLIEITYCMGIWVKLVAIFVVYFKKMLNFTSTVLFRKMCIMCFFVLLDGFFCLIKSNRYDLHLLDTASRVNFATTTISSFSLEIFVLYAHVFLWCDSL